MKRAQGFTLVEVLVAVFFLGLIVIGFSLIPNLLENMRVKNEYRNVAGNVAEQIMEEYINTPFADLQGKNGVRIIKTIGRDAQYRWSAQVLDFQLGNISQDAKESDFLQPDATGKPQVRKVVIDVEVTGHGRTFELQRSAIMRP